MKSVMVMIDWPRFGVLNVNVSVPPNLEQLEQSWPEHPMLYTVVLKNIYKFATFHPKSEAV